MDYRDIDLTGSSGPIYFRYQDTFHGIALPDLLARLRLDPGGSPVDLCAGVSVYLDDDEVPLPDSSTLDDIDALLGEAPQDGWLVRADDGGFVSAGARLRGGWLIDLFYEVRHEATWVGEVADRHVLALTWMQDRAAEWGVGDLLQFNVESPYLDWQTPGELETLRSIADLGVRVTLNSFEIVSPTSA